MSVWRHLTRGLRVLAHRDAADHDVSDELQHYAEEAEAEYFRRGMSRDAAQRAAQLEIGNMTVAREHVRSYGWENLVDSFLADVRYALRRLRRSLGFTAISALTLALGIGATTAIFSAINPILLEPLPYPRAHELVTINDRAQGGPVPPTFGTFTELRSRSHSFQALAATDAWRPSLTGTNEPERLRGQRVSAEYFRVLGVTPLTGRDFTADEDQPGAQHLVVLSDRLLQRRFGGDLSIVGRTVSLDGNPYLVVGVMPPRFTDVVAPQADVWTPLQEHVQAPYNAREWGHHYGIVARLAAGARIDGARRELEAIARAPIPEFPRPTWADLSQGVVVQALQDDITSGAKPALFAIVGAVALLLVIACVNVTNLLLARSAQRRAELAMRAALGAGRSRLVRQLLTESVILALVGGTLGLIVAQLGVRAFIALSPSWLPRLEAIRLDAPVFAFAFVITAVIGLIVGLVPALGAAGPGLHDELQRSSRRAVGGRAAARSVLVVTEVALALVLLVSTGLLMRSLQHLFGVAPGFNSSHLLSMQVIDPGHAHPSDSLKHQYYQEVLDAVRSVPGVEAAAFTSQLPLSGDLDGYGYDFQSIPAPKPGEDGSALRYAVTPSYFATMGIPLRQGRLLEESDVRSGVEAIVISESLARRRFGNRSPIGERVRFGPEVSSERPWDIIVGVVGDVKQQWLGPGKTDAFYVAMGRWWWVDNVQSLVVRTRGEPSALTPTIKRAIWSVGTDQPIQRIATMDALIASSASDRHFTLIIIETFAAAALILAAIGLYGVLSGSVTERTRELGVRAALGATQRDILRLVMHQGLLLTVLGSIIGVAAATAATRILMSLLFEVSRLDPVTYVGVLVVLGGVSALACWLPAARASRVDPAVTLRAE